jgi:hypothetical protein
MGIVKISDLMHDNLRDASDALSRSINAQAEHWLRVGMLSELHPELSFVRPELKPAASVMAGKVIRKAAR